MSRIKISHDLNEMSEKTERILIMQDKSVLDDSDDEAVAMEDVDLARLEKDKVNERRSKHGKKFNPYDDDWNTQSESVLSKYDDFEETEKKLRDAKTRQLTIGTSFKENSIGPISESHEYDANDEMPSNFKIDSKNYSKMYKTSSSIGENLSFQKDFYTPQEVTSFKKPVKDKKKKRRVNEDQDEPIVDLKEMHFSHGAEEDEELYSQLSRLRRIERSKINLPNEDTLANAIIQTRDEVLDPSEATPSISVANFLSRVHAAQTIPDMDTMEIVKESPSIDVRMEEKDNIVEEESHLPEELKDETTEPIIQDIKVDSGLACALKFFQSRGDIEKPRQETDNVRLEHRDEFGRVLNQKEAYKQLSWKFHGVKPSAAKQEKRLRKIDNEIKARSSGDAAVGTKLMNEFQKEGKSHLVIPYK